MDWVAADEIATFNRLQALTTDKELIVRRMRQKATLIVSDDGHFVRRSTALGRDDSES